MDYVAYDDKGRILGSVAAYNAGLALDTARRKWQAVVRVEPQIDVPPAPKTSATKQLNPRRRSGARFERLELWVRPGERGAFIADATTQGFTAIAYLRGLWAADRKRRKLPPWEPPSKPQPEVEPS